MLSLLVYCVVFFGFLLYNKKRAKRPVLAAILQTMGFFLVIKLLDC